MSYPPQSKVGTSGTTNLVDVDNLQENPLFAQTLGQALRTTYSLLTEFAATEDFIAKISLAVGDSFNAKVLELLAQAWLVGDFDALPSLRFALHLKSIRPTVPLLVLLTQSIYRREFLSQNAASPGAVADVLLELEYRVDLCINPFDAAGDQGANVSASIHRLLMNSRSI